MQKAVLEGRTMTPFMRPRCPTLDESDEKLKCSWPLQASLHALTCLINLPSTATSWQLVKQEDESLTCTRPSGLGCSSSSTSSKMASSRLPKHQQICLARAVNF